MNYSTLTVKIEKAGVKVKARIVNFTQFKLHKCAQNENVEREDHDDGSFSLHFYSYANGLISGDIEVHCTTTKKGEDKVKYVTIWEGDEIKAEYWKKHIEWSVD